MERVIAVVDGAGRSFPTTCRVTPLPERGYRLELEAPEIGTEVGEAHDAFECLSIVRRDQKGLRAVLQWSSARCLGIGHGPRHGRRIQAYLLTIGKIPELSDLVDIFESAPVEAIATVEEQGRFFQTWVDTPRT